MNTNTIVAGALIVLVGVGGWLIWGGQTAEAPAVESDAETQTSSNVKSNSSSNTEESFSGIGSFVELMGMGKNISCEFSHVSEETGGAVAGEMKISGEKLRGDFEMQQGNQVYVSHMIQDGDFLYTWSETPDGMFAMKMSASETESKTDESDFSRPVDMDNDVDYKCKPWVVSASAFAPPSDIEFMDTEQMMQNMMQGFDPASL